MHNLYGRSNAGLSKYGHLAGINPICTQFSGMVHAYDPINSFPGPGGVGSVRRGCFRSNTWPSPAGKTSRHFGKPSARAIPRVVGHSGSVPSQTPGGKWQIDHMSFLWCVVLEHLITQKSWDQHTCGSLLWSRGKTHLLRLGAISCNVCWRNLRAKLLVIYLPFSSNNSPSESKTTSSQTKTCSGEQFPNHWYERFHLLKVFVLLETAWVRFVQLLICSVGCQFRDSRPRYFGGSSQAR